MRQRLAGEDKRKAPGAVDTFERNAADGAGGVKVSSTAVKRLVVAIDSSSKTLTLLL